MSTRSFHPLVALAGAAVLGLSLVGSAVAQEEEATAAPVPEVEVALDAQAERAVAREERKAERAAQRDERRAERDAAKAVRAAEREEHKADRSAAKEERKARRSAAQDGRRAEREAMRAAWAQVKDACAAEMQAVRTDEALGRADRREALREARVACKESYLAAKAEAAVGEEPVDELYTEAVSDGTGVVRTDLGIADPGSAPGEALGLWHYFIPAHTELAAHTHPGWQLARVTDGELEYTVIEGEGILLRADGSEEPMGPGTYVLATGDGVIENPQLIHLGANRTDEPVTIISATLFEAGEPISTLVDDSE